MIYLTIHATPNRKLNEISHTRMRASGGVIYQAVIFHGVYRKNHQASDYEFRDLREKCGKTVGDRSSSPDNNGTLYANVANVITPAISRWSRG